MAQLLINEVLLDAQPAAQLNERLDQASLSSGVDRAAGAHRCDVLCLQTFGRHMQTSSRSPTAPVASNVIQRLNRTPCSSLIVHKVAVLT